ncbi:MAG TPA: Fis family transcriptional regulator [Cyanobacteria bacterium UBA8543]|nr:Fis family transcriptional regulator [Cyanobacteria bacterium UBA8543]
MQPYKIGLTALVSFLAIVSMPLTIGSVAVVSALPTATQTQDTRKAQADQLFQQGIEQYQKGQLEAAIESWEQALLIYQQLQNRQGEGATLENLGAIYLYLGNYNKAIEFLQPFLAIAKNTGNRSSEAQALGNLGIAYKGSGKYTQSIESHQQALTLMRELNNRQGEGQILGNLGNTYEALGDYEKAIASYQQSLEIAREINDPIGEGIALGTLGAINSNLGKYGKAIEFYQQSLVIAQTIGDTKGQANTFNNLGNTYHIQGNLTQALEYYTQSLSLARAIGDRKLEGEVLLSLAMVYEDQRDFTKAIEHQQQSLRIAQEIGDRRVEALAFNNLGHTLFNSGNLKEAEEKLREAVSILESFRPGLTDANNVSIFDTQVLSYNLLQQILIAQNNYPAALEIAERGRARAFVELLAQRLSPQVALSSTVNSGPPTIDKIKQIAQAQNATLVEYSLVPDDEFKVQGKQRGTASQLYIWVVQPSGKVAFRRVDLKALRQQQNISLEQLVASSREAMGIEGRAGLAVVSTSRPGQPERLKQLHQWLIEPIADLLPTEPNAPVIFIPQDFLFSVSFAALQDTSGQYLIEKHTILTAPAIQILDLTHQQQQRLTAQQRKPLQGKDVLVVGNPTMPTLQLGDTVQQLPPLPGSQQEAEAIAKLLNTKALIGDQATKVKIVQQLPNARLVHLATHGLLDDIKQLGVPGAIALAPSNNDDGFLTAGEIINLRLNAQLIVLSACHTGQGDITGDGVIGLSRSLIAAGVPSAIVSLWAVPDAPTSLLMTEFYRYLQQNSNKAQALRNAMLTTMKQHPNPRDWAAFTLIGEAQ